MIEVLQNYFQKQNNAEAVDEAESYCDRIIVNLNRPVTFLIPPSLICSVCVCQRVRNTNFSENFFYVLNGRSLVAFVANSVTQNTLEGVLCLVKLLFLAVWFLATENQSDCFRNWTLLLVFYDILFSRYESIMLWFLSGIFSWYRMSFLL